MIYTAHCDSPLGRLTLAEQDGGLVGLWLEGQKYYFGSLQGETCEQTTPLLAQTQAWLTRYFAGEQPRAEEIRRTPQGSPFRREVWQLLCEIPYGQVVSYGELARRLAQRTGQKIPSAQAVGGAVGHNPISLLIPCHRVVGADGSLTGYAGGVDKKLWLLSLEGADLTHLHLPRQGTAL